MRAACVRVSRRPHGAGEGVRTWAGNWRWTFSPCAEIGRTGETTGRASSGQGARDRRTVAESVDAALMTLGAAGGSVKRLSASPEARMAPSPFDQRNFAQEGARKDLPRAK